MERQQKRLDEFRHVYNQERPHEALGQKRPATIYRPSPRRYPESLPPIEHAGHLVEEIDDGVWSVYYGPVLLARFEEREVKFYG